MTTIKKAETSDNKTILVLTSDTRRGVSGFQEAVFFVDMITDGKLESRDAYSDLRQALDRYYKLVEDGILYAGKDFQPVPSDKLHS